MTTTNPIQNPVFEELAFIQASLDEFRRRNPKSKPLKCRASLSKGSRRCQHNGWSKDQDTEAKELFFEFNHMTECPETDILHEKMELIITYTYCPSHLGTALQAFRKWEKQRSTVASSLPLPPSSPSPSASASLSPLSSFDDTFSTTLSEISYATSQSSLPVDDIHPQPVSDCESDSVPEDDAKTVLRKTTSDSTDTIDINTETDDTSGDFQKRSKKTPDFGDAIPIRRRSMRNHSTVFQVIMEHPKGQMMQEGIIYVLKHKKVPDTFNIGFATGDAKEELSRTYNCHGADTESIYESNEIFHGARQAEKIIHTWLFSQNLFLQECGECGKCHGAWFRGSRKALLETVSYIETFIQMPAYVEENGEWKLSAEAYEVVKPMCHFDPSLLSKYGNTVQKVARASLGAIEEAIPPKTSQEASEHVTQAVDISVSINVQSTSKVTLSEIPQESNKGKKPKASTKQRVSEGTSGLIEAMKSLFRKKI